jgi:glycosyltransferase involved in cell wall biosynthesis
MELPHITICICTYQRPVLLRQLFDGLVDQRTHGLFTYSAVVADNDPAQSAALTIGEFKKAASLEVVYCAEPRRNIALVRNKSLENARGDFVAFIDDDEFPVKDWLLHLFNTCEEEKADGILGPVMPHFPKETPQWIKRGGFYDRPTHPTGFVMGWQECRTGNVLLRRSLFEGRSEVFDPAYNNAGEDMDFFRRMIGAGHIFKWCDEAVAYEVVPPQRWKRSFLLKRALFRGGKSLQHPEGRLRSLGKAVIAVPLYALALPFLLVAGHHLFMRYLVKLCDHAGRLLAFVRLNPLSERQM